MNRQQQHAARFYEMLRTTNPHLPDGRYVASSLDMSLGTEKATTVTLQIYVDLPDEWLAPIPEDARQEFWNTVKSISAAFACPACDASAGDPCFDLRYTKVQPRPTTTWPHKERFMPYIDEKLLAEAEEKGWIGAF